MIILYPTETLYALGVNALDTEELHALFLLKGRDESQVASWQVRNVADMQKYAEMSETAVKIAEQFLPGPLTLVLPSKDTVPKIAAAPDGTIGIRISTDPAAQKIVAEFMEEHDAPLTCTSANVHDAPTFSMPGEILQQFGEKSQMITQVHDDGPRKGLASTIVKVIGDEITFIREGDISEAEIREVVKTVPGDS
ncbi:MAG: L-threonylcarbamoyladenylate synthase [Patiriisocius sp.]|jgi:L-threonylcarbamoyladenylate synthase